MMNVLISSCFLKNTRYDGKSQASDNVSNIIKLLQEHNVNLILACPEQLGSLPTPRDPAEITGEKVITINGNDVTKNFKDGAIETLSIALKENVQFAVLKENSPSCGANYIYDGNFNKTKINGFGVTVKLLKENKIDVFSEDEIDKIKEMLCK